jgi:short-subunit dehydrogenase
MRREIAGSRILITGASQGIGKALALAAVKRGGKVLAIARSADLLQQLAGQVHGGGTLEEIQGDITSPDDRQRIIQAAQDCFGGLDVLVNNAGIGATGHFVDADADRLRKIFEVNFFGLTEMTRVCLPLLKLGNRPAIVNISSIAGRRGIPARSEYSASKFAVEGFSEAIRAELAKDGIDVIVVCPGLTQTNFSQNMIEQKALVKFDHLRGMTSEQVADATLRAIERGSMQVTLTLKGKLLVFVSRFFPRLADRIAARKVRSLFKEEIEARKLQRIRGTPGGLSASGETAKMR